VVPPEIRPTRRYTILGPLRALDSVAYLRLGSVYKVFSSADDFEDQIALLRMEPQKGDSGAGVRRTCPHGQNG
jgi:hypothetical protein